MTMKRSSPHPLTKNYVIGGLLCLLLCLVSCQENKTKQPVPKTTTASSVDSVTNGPQTLLMPTDGAYTGAFIDFGEGESHVTYDALVNFEHLTGKHLAVVAFGNFWGDQQFPTKAIKIISTYGAVPLLYWSPWDKPYDEGRAPDRFNLNNILSGKCDSYIDAWAENARAYGKPLLVTWGLEMNGTWFPWSGSFYGGGKIIGQKDGHPVYAGPEKYKQAYRYVVDRVRAKKATNILWGFHVNNLSMPAKVEWNQIAQYYPGANYVDWLGLSVYGKMSKSDKWLDFQDMIHLPYEEVGKLDANKPIFLAEWGVGEFKPGDKAGFIRKAFELIPHQYPRVRLAVFWHERWENSDGSYSNLRVNSSPESLEAYRQGVASPYWVDKPKLAPAP